jgi:hypothetical protein
MYGPIKLEYADMIMYVARKSIEPGEEAERMDNNVRATLILDNMKRDKNVEVIIVDEGSNPNSPKKRKESIVQ